MSSTDAGPPAFDTSVAHIARVYDYWLGGKDNYAADRAVGAEYMRAVARLYAERAIRFADGIEAAPEVLGQQWADRADMSHWLLDLDLAEAAELRRGFHELCAPFRHDDANQRPGTRRVIVQFQILPTPAKAPSDDGG